MEEYIKASKQLAKMDKELPKERWVTMELGIRNTKPRSFKLLHRIELPCSMLERWEWVVNWRRSKLICQHPREHISTHCHYYYKTPRQKTGMQELLYRLSASKAQVTKVEKDIDKYIKDRSQNDMFFDPDTDQRLLKKKAKLEEKKKNLTERQSEVQELAKRYEGSSCIRVAN